MKKITISIVLATLCIWSCTSGGKKEDQEVPTTLEQHDGELQTSSSWSSSSTGSGASSSTSASGGGAPTSFAFSTSSSAKDTTELTDIRDIAEDKGLRDYLQAEMIKFLLSDKLINTAEDRIDLTITNEWVMINKKVIDDEQAQKYVDLLKSKMTMGNVFNYSFNQY